mgnify:CR=1 FL=1
MFKKIQYLHETFNYETKLISYHYEIVDSDFTAYVAIHCQEERIGMLEDLDRFYLVEREYSKRNCNVLHNLMLYMFWQLRPINGPVNDYAFRLEVEDYEESTDPIFSEINFKEKYADKMLKLYDYYKTLL